MKRGQGGEGQALRKLVDGLEQIDELTRASQLISQLVWEPLTGAAFQRKPQDVMNCRFKPCMLSDMLVVG